MAGLVPAIHVFFNSVLILRRTVRSVSKEDSVFSGISFETPANAGSSGWALVRKDVDHRHKAGDDVRGAMKGCAE
jgi:hypothetical protein